MGQDFRTTTTRTLVGDGTLSEGDRHLGRVTYRLTYHRREVGFKPVSGAISVLPGEAIDLFVLMERRAPLTLVLSNGSWDCTLQSMTLSSRSAHLASRGPLRLDDEP